MVTPGSTPPDGSVTFPKMDPIAWAWAGIAHAASMPVHNRTARKPRIIIFLLLLTPANERNWPPQETRNAVTTYPDARHATRGGDGRQRFSGDAYHDRKRNSPKVGYSPVIEPVFRPFWRHQARWCPDPEQ